MANTSEAFSLELVRMKRFLKIATLFSILLIAGFYSARYFFYLRPLAILTEPIANSEIVSQVEFTPSFLSSFARIEGRGILTVSTGKISHSVVKDRESGEVFGQAKILETFTRDNLGRIEKLEFIVQLSPSGNLSRNVIPWIISRASQFQSLPEPGYGEVLGEEALSQLFSKGSQWVFIPLLDLNSEGVFEALPEYRYYAQRYYGDEIGKFQNFVEAKLLGIYRNPILLLDIFYFSK